jgi:hypothetical protein
MQKAKNHCKRKSAKESWIKGLSPKEGYFTAGLKQYAQRAGDFCPWLISLQKPRLDYRKARRRWCMNVI